MGVNFKYLSDNFITGTSQLGASSGTARKIYLNDRDEDTQWISSSEGTDGTSSTITWTPATAQTIDRLFLQNHNFATYEVFYNGTESNTFTPPVSISGNSSVNSYHEFTAQAITSVTIKATNTISPNTEKACGDLFFGTQKFEAPFNPSEYNPMKRKKGFDLEMADGGVKSIMLGKRFYADMQFNYIGTSDLSNFKNLYKEALPFYFMPCPVATGTGWDGEAWRVNWVDNYDAMKLSGGVSKEVGYDVNMILWETSA